MPQINFCHGRLADDYETQANEQGYTLGEYVPYFENVRQAYLLLDGDSFLTDEQSDAVCRKIQKKLAASIKKLES